MKKFNSIIVVVGLCLCSLFLTACGGGGGASGSDQNPSSPAFFDNAKAALSVQVDKMVFKPAMLNGLFAHLSDGTKEVFIDKKNVKKIFWNGPAVGWHLMDPSKGVDLQYDGSDNPTLTIAGQPLSPVIGGNFTFLTSDGRELSQITDAKWLTIMVAVDMTAERRTDGLFYGSSATAPPVITAKTVVNVNTVTGEVEITPTIVNGRMINLVNSNPTEQVLDAGGQVIAGYRIAWNDNNSWYPASGKLAALQLPKTVVGGAVRPVGTGSGMPYLVRPDGSFVPFNTDPLGCSFTVNGVLTKIDVNGLMSY